MSNFEAHTCLEWSRNYLKTDFNILFTDKCQATLDRLDGLITDNTALIILYTFHSGGGRVKLHLIHVSPVYDEYIHSKDPW